MNDQTNRREVMIFLGSDASATARSHISCSVFHESIQFNFLMHERMQGALKNSIFIAVNK